MGLASAGAFSSDDLVTHGYNAQHTTPASAVVLYRFLAIGVFHKGGAGVTPVSGHAEIERLDGRDPAFVTVIVTALVSVRDRGDGSLDDVAPPCGQIARIASISVLGDCWGLDSQSGANVVLRARRRA
jgi:hypothetical protein